MTSPATDGQGSAVVAPPLSLDHVRKELQLLHGSRHRTPRAALFAKLTEPVAGRTVLVNYEGQERAFRVVDTVGELDLRRKLAHEQREEDHLVVYLVPFARDLPRDLEGSFALGRVWWPSEERTLPRRFGARTGTPRFIGSKLRQIAQRDEGRDYATGDAPSIDLDDAWLVFLRDRLGVSALDTETQLFVAILSDRQSRGSALKTLLAQVPSAEDELSRVLGRRLGSWAGPILRAWLGDSAVELAAISVVGEATRRALTERDTSFALLTMALEMRIAQAKAHPLATTQGEDGPADLAKSVVDVGSLASAVFDKLRDPEHEPLRRAILKEAESLLDKEQLRPLALSSNRLSFVFQHRCGAFEKAVQAVVDARDAKAAGAVLGVVDRASYDLRQHDAAKAAPNLVTQVEMASRLAAFLAEPPLGAASSPRGEVIQLARFQLEIGGWVDWARQIVREDTSGPLGKSLLGLVGRVDRVRDDLDARFAAAYARIAGTNGDRSALAGAENIAGETASALLIEDAVSKVALGLLEQLKELKLLVLVMDGMSAANLAELWTRSGAISLVPVSLGRRLPIVAHIPTITKLSRSALFAGRALAAGDSLDTSRDEERFAKHPVVVRMGERPTVLLRSEILASGGGLSDDAKRAVSGDRRIVAVVVNAIDDQLKGSAQMRVAISQENIKPFKDLLEDAERGARLVLLMSDHGNISSQRFIGAAVRSATSEAVGVEKGARHRPLRAGENAGAGEIEVPSGALAAASGVTRVAVAVSETVRYTSLLHAGEHGGASLAEAIAPCVLLAPRWLLSDLKVLGVETAPISPPRFWDREAGPPLPSAVPEIRPAAPAKRGNEKPSAQVALPFDAAAVDASSWLFSSKLFQAETRNLGPSDVADVKRATALLLKNGCDMSWDKFASELDIGRFRVPGFVDKLERVLNYGGDVVIEADRSRQRVIVHRPLLEAIFREDAGE